MAHDGSLPTIKVLVEGKEARALVDTGCTATMIHLDFSKLQGHEQHKSI